MEDTYISGIKDQAIELGDLLANTIGSVVNAQERLDLYTEERRKAYENAPAGSMALPPLWYVFNNVSVELELAAKVSSVTSPVTKSPRPHLLCRTLNPSVVSLYGRQAAAGLRIKVDLSPQGFLPIKETSGIEPTESENQNSEDGNG